MREKSIFAKSSVSASALFVLGNGIITLPYKGADKYTFLEFLCVSILTVLLSFLLLPIAKKIENKGTILLKIVFLMPICIGSLFVAADTFLDFTRFISTAVLPQIPTFAIIITFLAAVIYFATKRQENILKFSLIVLFLSLLAIIFFFFATMKSFDMRNIFIFRFPKTESFLKGSIPYIQKVLLPSLILPFYSVFIFGNKKSGSLIGTALGLSLLGICLLTSILIFSAPLASRLSYPYFSAVSTVSIGRIFTRMDAFSYLLYFSSSIIRISICIFTSFKALKSFHCR